MLEWEWDESSDMKLSILYFLLSYSEMPSEQELHHASSCAIRVKNRVQ